MSILLIGVIIIFKHVLDRNVIDSLLTVATYTYGPLLGLFAFGIFTNYTIKDRYAWMVALASVGIIYSIAQIPPTYLGGYIVGYELLPINGIFTFIGLFLIRQQKTGARLSETISRRVRTDS